MQLSQIPGYERAERRGRRLEDARREWAFLGTCEKLCGVRVCLLTLRMFAELIAIRSPFLCGGDIGGEDVVLFLWRLSPRFSRDDHELRLRFFARVRAVAFEPEEFRRAVRSVFRFIDRMLCDRPPSSTGGSQSDVSFVASLVHEIATAYGWDRDTILDTPMPQVFQYVRKIQREHNPKLPRFNPVTARLTKRLLDRALAEAQVKAASPQP